MTIRFFRSVRFPGDWELNFITRRWNFRIGRSQVALWREVGRYDYRTIFNWMPVERAPRG